MVRARDHSVQEFEAHWYQKHARSFYVRNCYEENVIKFFKYLVLLFNYLACNKIEKKVHGK